MRTHPAYAYERMPAGAILDDLTDGNYGKGAAAELRAVYEAFPEQLAAEINDFNSRISPYDANVCGRKNPRR